MGGAEEDADVVEDTGLVEHGEAPRGAVAAASGVADGVDIRGDVVLNAILVGEGEPLVVGSRIDIAGLALGFEVGKADGLFRIVAGLAEGWQEDGNEEPR